MEMSDEAYYDGRQHRPTIAAMCRGTHNECQMTFDRSVKNPHLTAILWILCIVIMCLYVVFFFDWSHYLFFGVVIVLGSCIVIIPHKIAARHGSKLLSDIAIVQSWSDTISVKSEDQVVDLVNNYQGTFHVFVKNPEAEPGWLREHPLLYRNDGLWSQIVFYQFVTDHDRVMYRLAQ